MIDPAEATDPEILAAVEAWARARGYWEQPPIESRPWSVRWQFSAKDARLEIRRWHPGGVDSWVVPPLVALAWALCVEAGDVVDVGRCPACVKRGGCPDCNGTGVDRREAARLVLDAAPRTMERGWWRHAEMPGDIPRLVDASGRIRIDPFVRLEVDGERRTAFWTEPGDQASIDALTVHAERLMLDGSDLGELLALYLTRWSTGEGREGTAEAVRRLPRERDRFAAEYDCVLAPPEPEDICDLCGEPIREGQATHAGVAHWTCAQAQHRRQAYDAFADWLATAAPARRRRRR